MVKVFISKQYQEQLTVFSDVLVTSWLVFPTSPITDLSPLIDSVWPWGILEIGFMVFGFNITHTVSIRFH